MHMDNVIFEIDSQCVIQGILSNNSGIYEFSLLIRSIPNFLQIYPNFEIKFVKRQTNMVVHSLENAVDSLARRNIINLISRCIEHYLLNKMC
ncbi:unnamed protein product [Lathyrus sativus]|nr:unnamed protein product [Lathyrus sativus]